jgi:hypothetical protein
MVPKYRRIRSTNSCRKGFQGLDAQLIIFFLRHGKNVNVLPYTIRHIASNTPEQAEFVPTSVQDLAEIQAWPICSGNTWSPGCAAFYPVWLHYVSHKTPPPLKLMCVGNPHGNIQGLVHLDQTKPCGDQADRVIETAPDNQTGVSGQVYGGVGKALVVRMVLECFLQGKQPLFIRTDRRNTAFYTNLHFKASPRVPGQMVIDLQNAERLIKEFFGLP